MNKKSKPVFSILMILMGYVLNCFGWMDSILNPASVRVLMIGGGLLLLVTGFLLFLESLQK